jgi:5'-deoxynucleotidase YfbR-like HD superfamily hydrolase
MDEVFSTDIPYPFKKAIKEQYPEYSDVLLKIKEVSGDMVQSNLPDELRNHPSQIEVLNDSFNGHTSPEARFVKFLDYVSLYLNCYRMNKLYSLSKTIDECKKLTSKHEYYEKCPLVQQIIEQPELFINNEFN